MRGAHVFTCQLMSPPQEIMNKKRHPLEHYIEDVLEACRVCYNLIKLFYYA